MDDLFAQLEELAATERRVTMATLVATKGTSPKKEGAKMLVGPGGRVLGAVTIGGCVDARVIEESESVLAGAVPRLLKMALGDEDAWEMGLSCGGTVEVLLEPLALSPTAAPLFSLYRRIGAELAAGRGACLVRVLGDPARALLVLAQGKSEGSLGSAAADESARAIALEQLARRTSVVRALSPAGNSSPGGNPAPGGDADAFFEVHAPRAHLISVGAGHVAMPLVTFARGLGFRTTVIDARPRFASRERFPDADELKVGIVSEIVEQLPLGPQSAVVITVHDYKVEAPVLQAVLRSGAGYIGMLGNRKRGEAVLEMLREKGFSEEELARVRVPIGLDIGAQSASEIALAILAQVVAERSGKPAPGRAAKERAP